MAELNILNKKKIKEILALIKKQWGTDFKTELVFLMNTQNKIFLVNREVFNLNLEKLRINSIQAMQWLKGQDIDIKGNYKGFVILKHENDFLGTGKYKDGKVLNYVPKARRFKYNLEIEE